MATEHTPTPWQLRDEPILFRGTDPRKVLIDYLEA